MKKFFILIASLLFCLTSYSQEINDSLRYNQYGAVIKQRTPLRAEMRDGILVFESSDRNYRFWFDIRIQLDGGVFFGKRDYMNPIGNGVNNRRSRFAIKTQISNNWYGEIDTDLGNGEFELKDIIIRYTGLKNWSFTLGNFKEDFSIERTTTSRYLGFLERPMVVQALAPSRHLGFNINYNKNWFYASSGIFFQEISDRETSTWVKDNNKDFGRDQGYSLTSKIVFNPLYKHIDKGVHLGFSGSYRTPKTDVAKNDYESLRYSVRNSSSINRKKYLDTDLIRNVNHNILSNIELAAHYQAFRFQAEYIVNNVYIKKTDANLSSDIKRFSGWYAQVGYLLFGGKQRYNLNEAEFTQAQPGAKWGDIELMLRYDYLNLNSGDIFGGAGENYTLGLNYYISKSMKFAVNYMYSKNDRYANGKGKLFVGTDKNGQPSTNFKEIVETEGQAGIRYSQIGVRLEIDF